MQIAAAYERTYHQTIRRDTLEGLEDLVGWLLACVRREGGDVFWRTWAQIFRGCGWAAPRPRAARQRYRVRTARWLKMLEEMGWLEGWEAVYEPSGAGRCIELRPASVLYQLSYLAARRKASAHRLRTDHDRALASSRVTTPGGTP